MTGAGCRQPIRLFSCRGGRKWRFGRFFEWPRGPVFLPEREVCYGLDAPPMGSFSGAVYIFVEALHSKYRAREVDSGCLPFEPFYGGKGMVPCYRQAFEPYF